MMEDRKPEAAAFGRPGRTVTVINRALRPSIKPRRVVVRDQLFANKLLNAVGGLWNGHGIVVDHPGHGESSSPPKTATELEKTKTRAPAA